MLENDGSYPLIQTTVFHYAHSLNRWNFEITLYFQAYNYPGNLESGITGPVLPEAEQAWYAAITWIRTASPFRGRRRFRVRSMGLVKE